MYAIETESLYKQYDQNGFSLENVSFCVPKGAIFGFLGPNGSGKTTMVRILNGILKPTKGEARIFGERIAGNENAIHRNAGVATELAGLYEAMTASDNLKVFGNLFGMQDPELSNRIAKLLDMFELTGDNANRKPAGTFSMGMKKSLSVARALLHKPKLLYLDEPTNGLDPEAAANVTRLVRNMVSEEKVTVFLCTHQLKYAEEMCSLYGLISNGKMLGFGTFAELSSSKGAQSQLRIRGSGLPDYPGGKWEAGEYVLSVADDSDAASRIHHAIQSGGVVYEARQTNWSLEELYFEYQKGAKIAASR